MELLLWLWFYDNRFFFSLKIPTTFYQLIWVVSIIINLLICSAGGYFIIQKKIIDSFIRILLLSNITICGITLIISIGFILRISYEHKKHFRNYSEALKTIPELSLVIKSNDFWVKNNSLNSFFGVVLLFCSIIIFFFSSGLMTYRKQWRIVPFEMHWLHEQNLLFYYAAYELLFTIPIFLEFLLSIVIKVGAFATVYLCPGLYSKWSKCLNMSKRNKTLDFSIIQSTEGNINGKGLLN